MKRLLEYQNKVGLFPTIGQKGGTKRELQSTFLHTFVLEYLLDYHSEKEDRAIQKGIDFLVSQAVNENGWYLWGWLKNPSREEDYHPPDTDDTMRARLVIEKALQKGFGIPKAFEHFDYDTFLHPLMTKNGSILTYVRGSQSGSCPIVNINILYALTSIGGCDEIRDKIKGYLKLVANSEIFDSATFIEQSRYYLSALFPVYVLSKIIKIDPELFLKEEKQRVLEYAKRFIPKNTLERAWLSTVLKEFDQEALAIELSFDWIPVFRSMRLGEFYGSGSMTAVFCLESHRKGVGNLR